MNKTKVVLVSLILVVQVLTIVGGFYAYREMDNMLWKALLDYKKLVEETGGPIIDYGLIPNPLAPLLPLVLLGVVSTIALLILEVREGEKVGERSEIPVEA